MRRTRNAKIVATLGPASSGPDTVRQLFLAEGAAFRLDLDMTPGSAERAGMPHPEIFAALAPGAELLLDDGRRLDCPELCAAP